MSAITSDIDTAIAAISGGFPWSSSKKGHSYWSQVISNLEDEKNGTGGKDPNDI